MQVIADVISEVILLIDAEHQVLGGFPAQGPTRFEVPNQTLFYTYKRLVLWPGQCALCHVGVDSVHSQCVSRSGQHAIVQGEDFDLDHSSCASAWAVSLVMLKVEDLIMYVTSDNLFPIDEISQPLVV